MSAIQQYEDIRERAKYSILETLHNFKDEIVNSEYFMIWEEHALDELPNYLKTNELIDDINVSFTNYLIGKAFVNGIKEISILKNRKRKETLIQAETYIENEGENLMWFSIFKEALLSSMLEIRRNTIMKANKDDNYYEDRLRRHIATRLIELASYKVAKITATVDPRLFRGDWEHWKDLEDIFVNRFLKLRNEILPEWIKNPKPYQGFNEEKLTEIIQQQDNCTNEEKKLEMEIQYLLGNIEYYVIDTYTQFLKDYREVLEENPKWSTKDFRLLKNRLEVIEQGINNRIVEAVIQFKETIGNLNNFNSIATILLDIKENLSTYSRSYSRIPSANKPQVVVDLSDIKRELEEIKSDLKTIKYTTGKIAWG